MKKDRTYDLLVNKMHEINAFPPQEAGPFTGIYKNTVPYLKYSPWKSAVIAAVVFSLGLYFMIGPYAVKLASILQYGF